MLIEQICFNLEERNSNNETYSRGRKSATMY